ncbi:FAD-dependent oxidoreductase [Streptomyces coeruleorubidus]|uniref:NAD(P)/FAD-dependent oxidoreductase n=1 Tax=Streptomyces coeruleorubidus TaxID=116188 RepID=UPI00237FA2E9|nr:FAD-dependent oxidoreductase [Streptomyces coeruleorubidus]WDV54283.1 FAD-dependent oxidoreductase [Streptomyces coeruleorubidus]
MDTVDLAIVGGGVIGALVAREAVAAFPDVTVAVLERGLIGQGASSRSAGVHFPRGATARVRSMSEHSQHVWERLAAELDLPIREVDATVVTSGDADALSATYLRLGDETAPADPARGWEAPPGARAWTLPGCHYADVQGVAGRVLAGVRDRVTVLEGTEVTELSSDGAYHRLTLGQGRELLARRVVLAPGPWLAHPAWADLVAPLGLRVKKVVATHVESSPAPDDPLTIFDDEDAFLLPLHGRGHFLFSYTSDRWDVAPDDAGLVLEPSDLDDARAVLGRFAPGLVARCDSGRVFCDAYSPSREPVVAELRPGLVFAGAANGSGYRLAPAIAAETVAALDLTPTRTLSQPRQRQS